MKRPLDYLDTEVGALRMELQRWSWTRGYLGLQRPEPTCAIVWDHHHIHLASLKLLLQLGQTLIVVALKEHLLDGPLGTVQSLVIYQQLQPHWVQVRPTLCDIRVAAKPGGPIT